jgi:hypothetical protein
VENALHKEVCAGTLTLDEAQHIIIHGLVQALPGQRAQVGVGRGVVSHLLWKIR